MVDEFEFNDGPASGRFPERTKGNNNGFDRGGLPNGGNQRGRDERFNERPQRPERVEFQQPNKNNQNKGNNQQKRGYSAPKASAVVSLRSIQAKVPLVERAIAFLMALISWLGNIMSGPADRSADSIIKEITSRITFWSFVSGTLVFIWVTYAQWTNADRRWRSTHWCIATAVSLGFFLKGYWWAGFQLGSSLAERMNAVEASTLVTFVLLTVVGLFTDIWVELKLVGE